MSPEQPIFYTVTPTEHAKQVRRRHIEALLAQAEREVGWAAYWWHDEDLAQAVMSLDRTIEHASSVRRELTMMLAEEAAHDP